MRLGSCRLRWGGHRPGPIALTVTARRRSLGMSWPGCYVAREPPTLAPLPGDVDHTVGASLPISGLTAWQGLFQHGHLQAGQTVLVHGAAGAVGSMVTQLAREAGAYVIGAGRAAHR